MASTRKKNKEDKLKLSPPHLPSFYLPAGNQTPLGLQIQLKRNTAEDFKLLFSLSIVRPSALTHQLGKKDQLTTDGAGSVFKISAGSVGTSSTEYSYNQTSTKDHHTYISFSVTVTSAAQQLLTDTQETLTALTPNFVRLPLPAANMLLVSKKLQQH